MSNDVLIVGAGPTGLLLAAGLARYGIKPRLIDRNSHPSQNSKAIGVFARTLEVFEDLGVAEEAISTGVPLRAYNIHVDDKHIQLNLDEGNSFLPNLIVLPQSQTEAILGKLVERLGVSIERSVELTALEQDRDGVTTTLFYADGREEQCRSNWLIGCDGAGSTVRKTAEIMDEETTIPSFAVLADVETEIPLANDEFHAFVSADGIFGVIPLSLKNHWRLIADLPTDAEILNDFNLKLFEDIAKKRSHLQLTLTNSLWTSSFRFRQRMVSQCRKGRIFVAGDALSSHSPVRGQGMNTGLQDAYNLAWKLALAICDRASIELLNSYQAERLPISKALLTGTDLVTRGVLLRNPLIGQMRRAVASLVAEFNPIQKRIIETLSELNLNYRNSPIVQEDPALLLSLHTKRPSLKNWFAFENAPKAGDRAPDVYIQTVDGTRRLFDLFSNRLKHTLLLFAGKAIKPISYHNLNQKAQEFAKAFPDEFIAYIVLPTDRVPEAIALNSLPRSVLLDPQAQCHQLYGARGECMYLIRPDGYIGCRSQSTEIDKLKTYLHKLSFTS
jgi:2-polyprenyl-6-methoxyphenol hydroxylase-like FAD-dependent oxidoreductase